MRSRASNVASVLLRNVIVPVKSTFGQTSRCSFSAKIDDDSPPLLATLNSYGASSRSVTRHSSARWRGNRDVRGQRGENVGNRLDPQHLEPVAIIKRTLLPDVRSDVHDAARRTQEAIRIGRKKASQTPQYFHRCAA